jgi:hypothetical protein
MFTAETIFQHHATRTLTSTHGFAIILFTTVEARSRNITMIMVNVWAIVVKSCLEMFIPCLSKEMTIANVNILVDPLWNRFLAFPELL